MTEDSLANQDLNFSGVRLYSPGILAAYFILGNLPIGMSLYALNLARRGDRWIGYVLFGMSALTLVLLALVTAAGRSIRGWTLLALVIGLAVFRIESRPYQMAIRRGATPARWWPPLIAMLALVFMLALLMPEG